MYYGLDEVFLDFSFGSKKETWEKKFAGPMLKGTAGRQEQASPERLCDALDAGLLLHALLMPNKNKTCQSLRTGRKQTNTNLLRIVGK